MRSNTTRMRLYWRLLRYVCQWATLLYLRAHCRGLHRVPADGGVLLVCNHQSFVDPVLATMALHREACYMARDTLFANRFFGRLIKSCNAFPVKRNTADIGAIKEALRRLKRGMALLVFPEGTRTPDGRIYPMRPGLGAIAMKARVPIVPTLIDGAFQAWPKEYKLPRPGQVLIEYGQPIMPDEYASLSAEELSELIRNRLIAMQYECHSRCPRRRLEWYAEEIEN